MGNIKIYLHSNPAFAFYNNFKMPQAPGAPHGQVMQVITPGKTKDANGLSIYINRFTKIMQFHNILTLKFTCFYVPN